MTPRNPNGQTPRTLRDCTFSAWADPYDYPPPRLPLAIRLYVWALVVAAVGVVIYRSI